MAHDELNRYQISYDDEIRKWKQERTDLIVKTQELIAMNERIKVESSRQLGHYKTKHAEYKTKLR